ncbi:dihydroorotate dehydrogenase electron transfer subunit [Candidatus Bathyarchaeota archaeon]|nr:dihydroorotate dehydrogenase electron transfer subunit [Candidatus Bathyarchaeota archaeon]
MRLSAYRIAANKHRTTQILDITTQSATVKTYTFKDKECAKALPGQFLMLWIPGIDEIPLSVLDVKEDGTVFIVVKKVGEATEALHKMKAGEIVGVRGPFGNSFTLKKGNALLVGGGTGITPLLFLTKKYASKANRLVFVMGAKTRDDLLFVDDLEKICGKGNLIATTDDGSYGMKCLATTPLEVLLAKEKFDTIYTCGPERMMLQVLNLAEKHGIAFEASLERFMKCTIGLCGNCMIGKYRVCIDGPVFTSNQLKEVKAEFGFSKLDFRGRKIPL